MNVLAVLSISTLNGLPILLHLASDAGGFDQLLQY